MKRFWAACDRVYARVLAWGLEIAFGLGFLVWFIVSTKLTGGKL